MELRNNAIDFKPKSFFISLLCSYLVVGAFWLICMLLQIGGCPFPKVERETFFTLGLFIFSNFSFITFLAMIPFQQTEGKLSPGFYARIFNRPWSHFGLSILMGCFILCMVIVGIYEQGFNNKLLDQLFVAIIASMIFAVIFQRNLTLRYLYQPFIVYENLAALAKEEVIEEVWLDLYECSTKAIKDHSINNARSFFRLMANIYIKVKEKEKAAHMQKDVQSLYQMAKGHHPLKDQMERYWPFLRSS